MANRPLFAGLVFDENDQPLEVAYVGNDPCYVINDAGFRRHIPTEEVDNQVLLLIKSQIEGHEDIISEQAAKMLQQDDLFSRALIQNQLKNIDQQFRQILQTGIPEEGRTYLGMMGFRIIVDLHGQVIRFDQPGAISSDEGEDE